MKTRNKRLAAVFAVMLAISLFLGACGNKADVDGGQKPGVEDSARDGAGDTGEDASRGETDGDGSGAAGAGGADFVTEYPVTVTDQLGREVVIEEEPKTLVSGYYISSSLLIALGQQDKLVGIEAKAKSRPIYSLAAPKLLELPSVGTAKEFDLEGCVALKPDLVIIPAKLKETIPAMEELGLTVLAVNPENQELFTEMAKLLGVATNTRERAERIVSDMQKLLADVQEAVKGEEQPSVYMAGNSSFLSTAGGQMYQNSLIEQAGGKNVAGGLADTYWAEISYEQLLAWDPQYIILAAEADYTVESVLADAQLAECTAVKNGNVYQVPGGIEAWDSPVPGSALGSLWLASVLHPQAYSPEQYQQAVIEFYETYYGFTSEI